MVTLCLCVTMLLAGCELGPRSHPAARAHRAGRPRSPSSSPPATRAFWRRAGARRTPAAALPSAQALIEEYRRTRPAVLVVDAGDMFPFPDKPNPAKVKYLALALGRAGYDALALGDQEWLLGLPQLGAWPRTKNCRSSAPTSASEDGEPLFQPHVIRQAGGIKVGIFAVVADRAYGFPVQEWRKGLKVEPPIEAARREVRDLSAAGCQLIVALSHQPMLETRELAQAVPGIHLVVSGHDEAVLRKPEKVGGALLVAAGAEGNILGAVAVRPAAGGGLDLAVEMTELSAQVPDSKWVMDLYWKYVDEAKDGRRSTGRTRPFRPRTRRPRPAARATPPEYRQWATTRHARAYESIERSGRQNDPECLMCHTMGLGRPGGFVSIAKTPDLGRVTCQACHPVTSDHGLPVPRRTRNSTPKSTSTRACACPATGRSRARTSTITSTSPRSSTPSRPKPRSRGLLRAVLIEWRHVPLRHHRPRDGDGVAGRRAGRGAEPLAAGAPGRRDGPAGRAWPARPSAPISSCAAANWPPTSPSSSAAWPCWAGVTACSSWRPTHSSCSAWDGRAWRPGSSGRTAGLVLGLLVALVPYLVLAGRLVGGGLRGRPEPEGRPPGAGRHPCRPRTSGRCRGTWSSWLRQYLLVILVPLLALVAFNDVLARLVGMPGDSPAATVILLGALVAAMVLSAPWVRLCWRTEPLPPGDLRDRLLAVAERAGVRVGNVLVWRTNLSVANGCMIGMVGPLRYIMMTDVLLLSMTPQELEAVFAHEVAHVKYHHTLLYLVLALGAGSAGRLVGMLVGAAVPESLSAAAQTWRWAPSAATCRRWPPPSRPWRASGSVSDTCRGDANWRPTCTRPGPRCARRSARRRMWAGRPWCPRSRRARRRLEAAVGGEVAPAVGGLLRASGGHVLRGPAADLET